VPPYIAERWKAACGLAPASGGGGSAQQQPNANANASDSDGGDDEGGAGGGASLGRVTITTLRDVRVCAAVVVPPLLPFATNMNKTCPVYKTNHKHKHKTNQNY
jgi:hypothetical protein